MQDIQNILTLQSPENALPVIFDSPHSGHIYPDDFGYSCGFDILRMIEDRYVDELFSKAPAFGATLLTALFPRSYIDANRAIDDIDESLIKGKWPHHIHGAANPSIRSDSGIGLISRLARPGAPIYNRALSAEEIMGRIKNYYEPYHNTIRSELEKAHYIYGQFWHINCHSMPSSSAYPKYKTSLIGNAIKPSDIVLGDRDGQSCSRDFLYMMRDFWQEQGMIVTINDPFKGVELVSRYAQPTRGKNSLQIEINRALYMNEDTGEKSKDFDKIKNKCTDMIAHCTNFAQSHLNNLAAD